MTRETRTVLFTDVVGSTELRTTQGDDAGDAAVAAHDRVVRAAVQAHGGTVVKGTGDGCLAVFPSAKAAVSAALDIQRETPRQPPGTAAGVRIGINAGEVRDVDGDVFGEAVNAAARIAALAGSGEILVSRVVRDLLGTAHDVRFTERGEHELKGFPTPWELFRAAAASELPQGSRTEIRLLGRATVTVGGKPVAAFAAPRLQQLLARLILESGVPQARGRLAFELWPDSDERQARTNLRKLLHELRTSLPNADDLVEADTHSVRWRASSGAVVDVVTFLDAVGEGDLETAAASYGGDLLPGSYDDWLLTERERLRTMAIDVLRRLASDAEASGDDETVTRHARRLVQLDPLDEHGYRQLMQALSRRGDRAEAVRAYHRCVEALRRDLGVDPDPTTREAYEAIRSQAVTRSAPVSAPPPELVGRDAESAVARQVWERASSARAGVLLVTGEAGVGKSRLVEDLARSVAAEGHLVARTRAYEASGRFPWGPVVELLRSDAIRPALARLEAVWLAELALLLPELRAERPGLPEPPMLHEEARRQRLFEAVVRGLAAPARPLLLVVDDVQWCDPDTVELIGFLVRRAPTTPVLVAATARTDEVGDGNALPTVLAELLRDDALHQVGLDRLDPAATAELAARLTGQQLDQSAADHLWRETEGNALFIVEAVRSGLVAETTVTPTVQAVIRARLAHLSPDARELVDVAGTLGRAFTVEELGAATGRDEDDLVDSLDELWRRQIIREQGDGYDFSHDKLREVAHAEISPVRRRRLHRAVAEGLATLHGREPGPVSARLAAHYARAGLADEAVEAYRAAATHALALFSLDDAIGALRQALGLLERLPAGLQRDRREVAIRIAIGSPVSVREGYNSVSTREHYERALALSKRLGEHIDPAVLRGLGLAELVAGRFDRSRAFGEALLEAGDDPIAITEGHYLVGVSAFWTGDLAISDEHLRAALAAYRPEHATVHMTRFAQDPKAVCLIRLAMTVLWRGDRDGAQVLVAEATAHATELSHPASLAYVLLYAAIVHIELGNLDDSEAEVAMSESMWSRHSLRYFMDLSAVLAAWLAHVRGEADAPTRLHQAVDPWRGGTQPLHLTYGLALLARTLLDQGDVERGLEAIREALEHTELTNQRYLEPELLRIRGELLAVAGDATGADDALRRSIDLAEAQGAALLRDRTLESLATRPASR